MEDSNTNFVSSIKKIIWPINGYEHKKFLPMAFMMFCILMNYSMLRSVKDGFVVKEIGPEALGFIKTYVVLPSAILIVIAYSKLCNIMNAQRVFYTVTSFFLVYFALFAFILYPNPTLVHPNPETIENLALAYPNLKWFIRIIGKWTYASFYTFAEMWGSVMVSLLFWQFANLTTKPDEAKRFYSMYGLIGNLGLVATGYILEYLLNENVHLVPENLRFIPILCVNIASGVMIMFLYWWVNKFALTDPRLYDGANKKSKKSKVKLTLGESFKMILSSKYLGLIAMLVLAYGISINLVEGVWKSKINELYPTKEAYTMYMAEFQKWQGWAAIVFMVIGANILKVVSWRTAAFFTPVMILITGLIFFSFIFFGKSVESYLPAFIIISPLALAVLMGSIQNVLSKATKYSLFDSTKEMTYIPLDEELQTKGKSAVELIAGRFGKSGGGIIQSTTFMLFPLFTFTEAIPFFASIFFVMVLLWLYSVGKLSTMYQMQLSSWKSQKEKEKKEDQQTQVRSI